MATDEILGGRPEAALTHLHAAEDARDRAHPDVASALGTLRAAADHDTGLPLAGWQGMRHARMAAADLALPDPAGRRSPPSSSSTRPSVSAGPGRPARSPGPSPPGWWGRPRRRCSTRGCCG